MALFVCSLAVKLAGVGYMNRYLNWNLIAPDTRGVYQPLAVSLAQGRGYQINGSFRDAAAVAPGFPLYLAAVYKIFGFDTPTWWLGVLNALMRSGVTCLVFLLAARGFGMRAALAAGAIHALDPWEAFWAAFVLKESLAVLLSAIAICAVIWMLDRPTWARGIGAGLALALASLSRYATLGLFSWALVLLAFCGSRRMLSPKATLRLAASLTCGLLVGLSPWLIRNARVFGSPVVYTQAGYYFYVSNGPGTERTLDTWGYSGRSSIDMAKARDISGRHQSLSGRDAAFFKEAIIHLLTHPGAAATVIGARFVNMWRPTFEGVSTANLLVLGLPYCAILIASAIGLALGIHRNAAGDARVQLVLYWAVAFYVLLHLLFWSEIRYRQYAMPFLVVFAGLAVSAAWERRFQE